KAGSADIDADSVESASVPARKSTHVRRDALDAVWHPEERPRQLEADRVYLDHGDAAAPAAQHARERPAAATQQQGGRAAREQARHQADIEDIRLAARKHTTLRDAALFVEPRAGDGILQHTDLAVGTFEAGKEVHGDPGSSRRGIRVGPGYAMLLRHSR